VKEEPEYKLSRQTTKKRYGAQAGGGKNCSLPYEPLCCKPP